MSQRGARTSGVRTASRSKLEETLALQVKVLGLPVPEIEYVFAPPRKWRADFAWPLYRLLVEVEGGIFQGGRHTTGAGFEADCSKYNEATLRGNRLLRFTPSMIRSGEALNTIERAIKGE
jgi:hypothetical protein